MALFKYTEMGWVIASQSYLSSHTNVLLLYDFVLFQEYAGGAAVDVVLEMLANVNLQNDLQILAKHGRVIVSTELYLNLLAFTFARTFSKYS